MTTQTVQRRRAAQYLRMSTEHQRYSPDNQAAAIATYAASRGFEIVKTYIDAGQSGVTLRRREGLKALLADVLQGRADFSAILVLDISRWGRFQDTDQSAHYEFICREAGVDLHYCAEPFDNDLSPTSSIMKHVKRVMAAEFSRDLSEKVRRGKRRLASLGYKQSATTSFALRRMLIDPAGQPKALLASGELKALTDDRVILIQGAPEEVAVVRDIFRLFCVERWAIRTIAARLRAIDAPQYNAKPWSAMRVRYVLGNPLFCGTYVFGKSASYLRGPSTSLPPETWVRVEMLDPIVSKAVFEKAQRMIAHCHGGRPFSDEELLDGLRRLWRARGSLSESTINREPSLPSGGVYRDRFGSLSAAYERIGWWSKDKAQAFLGRAFTDEQMIAELIALKERYSFLSCRLLDATRSAPSPSALIQRFGSIAESFARAGYPVTRASQSALAERLRRCRFYELYDRNPAQAVQALGELEDVSRRALINGLKDLAIRHGRVTLDLINADPGLPSTRVFLRVFGTMAAARRAADLPIVSYSNEAHLERLRAAFTKHGKINIGIIEADKDCASPLTYKARFGSFARACEAAGVPYNPRAPRPRRSVS